MFDKGVNKWALNHDRNDLSLGKLGNMYEKP